MKRKLIGVVAIAILIISASAIIWMNSSDIQAAALPVFDDGGYALYMERAQTQEQKDALLALLKKPSIEGFGGWKRDALEILGELPKGSKRIKLEDAERINLKFNEESTIGFLVVYNKITHIVVNEKGERIFKPLESDLPTPKPYPTTLPNIKPILE